MRPSTIRKAALAAAVVLAALSLGLAQPGRESAQTVIGGEYSVGSGRTVDGNFLAIGADVALEPGSSVRGHVTVLGGSLTVHGRVEGDVHVYGGHLLLADTARIEGDLYASWTAYTRSPGAVVSGSRRVENGSNPVTFSLPEGPRSGLEVTGNTAAPAGPLAILARSLALALLAIGLAATVPGALDRTQAVMRRHTIGAAAVGLLSSLVAILAVLILAVTIVGIPLALLTALLVAVAVVFGLAALGTYVGTFTEEYFDRSWPTPLRAGIGTFILAVAFLAVAHAPVIGGLIEFGLSIVALGAVVLTRFGRRPYISDRAVPPSATTTQSHPA